MKEFEIELLSSIHKLLGWIEKSDYKAYEPFDGLNSFLRGFTLESKFLRQALIQFNKQFPINLRSIIGIKPATSSKGMAYMARGYLKLFKVSKEEKYLDKAIFCLDWLKENFCKGYSGYCWGNHFDYQTRGYFLKKGNPTLVWTALCGWAFYEAYKLLEKDVYGQIIDSVCQTIIKDFPIFKKKMGKCISYIPNDENFVNNANFLGVSVLAMGYDITRNKMYQDLAKDAVQYGIEQQLPNGAWYYGEENKYKWIDNWHTAYNLDSLYLYEKLIRDKQYNHKLRKGIDFYISNFFHQNGVPKYYFNKTKPYDIQCISQSIDTLILIKYFNKNSIELAKKVALFGIANMQDSSGYFYLSKNYFLNKTPTFHWGGATMFHALTNLYSELINED